MSTYLLDTNIVSFALRDPNGSVATRIRQVPDSQMVVSSIVVAELEYGYAKKHAHRALSVVHEFLDSVTTLPFARGEAVRYGQVRSELERRGDPIGDRDIMIAATALVNECVVVTDNVQHFEKVAGLSIENWQTRQ